MSSIPLPALGIHPVQSEDPLAAYGKVASLQGMLQQRQSQALQLQQQQQALTDQKATTAAMNSWDGKSYDYLSQLVLKNGGSANAALTIAQHGQQIKKTASDIAKDDAETGKTNLATTIEKNNQVLGAIDAAKGVPDDQLGQHLTQTAQNLVQQGLLDPQHAQAVQQLAQQPPQQMRGALDVLEKSLMGQKEQFEQAQKTQNTAIEQEKADTAQWKEAGQGTLVNTKTGQMIHGVAPVEQQELSDFLNRNPGKTPQDFPAAKAAREAAATQPYKLQVAAQEAKTKQAIEGMAKPVYAFDPSTQTKTLMSQTDAMKKGLLGVPVGEKQISDDTQLINRLTDVNNKINEYQQSLTKPLSDADKGNIAALIKDDDLKVGAFGTQLPVERLNAALNAENIKNLSPAARDAILSYFNARESLVGYNRVLSGSGRSNESALQLQLKTLPDPSSTDQDYAHRAFGQFKGNLKIVGQGLPSIPGVKSPEEWQRDNPPGGGGKPDNKDPLKLR